MQEKDIHMQFRDVASVSLLFVALEKEFPLFRSVAVSEVVEEGGKERREKVFHALKTFSTSFPQVAVDEKV
ncbi:MAG: hypothetical protein ACT4O9_06155 [Blastocatellia bacterium]